MSMQLSVMTSFICNKVGQFDANSLALCNTFVDARYRMIYDDFPWRDSEMRVSAVLSAGTNQIALPAGIDRIISVRSNSDTFLDPVSENQLVQTDPTIFERSGLPTVYFETTDPASNLKKVNFYPAPVANVALLIIGKRTMPALVNPTDTPILRNIDNVLIAFAMGDMLERQRQYAKAEKKFGEAQALLDQAKALETGQANVPRKAKKLTVAGNSLAEMTDAVCARTGQWSLESVVLIKDFIRRNYQAIWDMTVWTESTVIATVNTDGAEVILPPYFDRVISVRADPKLSALDVADISLYFGVAPNIFEQTGSAVGFSYLPSVGVAVLPPTREKLSFDNLSATNVFVVGELAGSVLSENVLLNGNSTPVQTVNQYDTVLTVAKSITATSVIVSGVTSLVTLVTLLGTERERKHVRIWLSPTPTTAQVCLILGKRTIKPLVQDEDTPMLRDIQSAIIMSSAADMFERLAGAASTEEGLTGSSVGYRSKAQSLAEAATSMRSRADAAVKTMLDLESQQGAFSAAIVPTVGYYNDFDANLESWYMPK